MKLPLNSPHPAGSVAPRGFTLMEVLVAIGIFAIGMTAIASLFPPAILLQRETVRQVQAEQFIDNARSAIAARGFAIRPGDADDWSRFDNNFDGTPPSAASRLVQPLLSSTTMPTPPWPNDPYDGGDEHPMDAWPWAERSHEARLPTAADRSLFWVPLVRDGNPAPDAYAWQGFVFVVRGQSDKVYDPTSPGLGLSSANDVDFSNPPVAGQPPIPQVMRMPVTVNGSNRFDFGDSFDPDNRFDNNPRLIRPGEKVLGGLGVIYTVQEADDTGITVQGTIAGNPPWIWYAAPSLAGDTATFVDLFSLNLGTGLRVLAPGL